MKTTEPSNGGVILCVDDEPVSLAIRKKLLESLGYRVFTADNGADALVLFSSETLDLVILDYSIPGMNGGVLVDRMKELRPDLPIILHTAYVDLPSQTLARVDKAIIKGELPAVLLGAIAELLAGRRQASDPSSAG